jgi:hypothetical protein
MFGGIAWLAAGLVGLVLAVVFAAAVVVIAAITSILLAFGATAVKARRAFEASDVIDARRVGGHSWVAYGWDRDA